MKSSLNRDVHSYRDDITRPLRILGGTGGVETFLLKHSRSTTKVRMTSYQPDRDLANIAESFLTGAEAPPPPITKKSKSRVKRYSTFPKSKPKPKPKSESKPKPNPNPK